MNLADNDQAIADLWRSMPEGAAPKRPSMELRRRRRRQLGIMWVEVLVGLGGVALACALMLQGSLGLGLATLFYCLFVGLLGLRARRGNINALDLNLAEQMQVTVATLRAKRNYETASALIWVAALSYFLVLTMLRGESLELPGQFILAGLILAIAVQSWRTVRARRRWSEFTRRAELLSEDGAG